MKTNNWKTIIAAITILPMALVSCHDEWMPGISGQGEIVEQTINPDEFDGFVSNIPADIYLTQGTERKVVVEAQQNIIGNIDVDRVEGGIWTLRYHDLVRYSRPVKIYITIPTLTKAGINGSGEITGLTPFANLDQLKLFISGSGGMDLDTDSKELTATITGSGDLTMAGQTNELNLVVSGSGSFHGIALATPRAELTISGSGSARLTVEEYLQVHVSGSGNVYYFGDPELDVHVSGSGNVVKGH
jgi:hypothetical protein